MKKIKFISLCLIAVLAVSLLAACGDTSYIMSVGEKKYPVGPYAFYAYYMRDTYDAQYQYYYSTSLTDVLNNDIDESGTKLYQALNESIKEQYIAYVVVSEKFDELGLSLTDEQKAAVEESYRKGYVESYGSDWANMLQSMKLSAEEFKDLLAVNYKNEAIVDYYFGEGGEKEILDTDMRLTFNSNYARFKYAVLYKVDGDGNAYTTDELFAQYDKAKAALADLEAGKDITEVIPLYSDDHYTEDEIPSDATEEDKEDYALQNASVLEDGLITDKTGIFNEQLYSYYGYSLDSALVNWLFSAEVGDYKLIELNDAYWVVQKCDLNEKEEYYEAKKDTIFNDLAADDISTLFSQWKNAIPYVFNDDATNLFDVRGLDPMFIDFES